jgi:hypothetical protein
MAMDRCYARHLGGCGGGISGEHFISKALLKRIEAAGGGVYVSGFPWLKDAPGRKRVGIGSLVANVLCRDHNSRLSDLDATGNQLVEMIEQSHGKERGFALRSVDGENFERFLLKVLCGILASRATRSGPGPEVIEMDPPAEWVDILFGRSDFPLRAGLYLPVELNDVWREEPNAYAIAPLLMNDSGVAGVQAVLRNRPFVVMLVNPGPRFDGALPPKSMWRPRQIRNLYPGGRDIIQFNWSGPHTGKPPPGHTW